MLTTLNPPAVAPPKKGYSHAVEAPEGARWLHISGQIGVRPDGSVPDTFEEQAEQAWRNLFAILEAAGYEPSDLVRTCTYLTRPEDVPATREVRLRFLADHEPTSTLVIVAGLAEPKYLFEVEASAAKT